MDMIDAKIKMYESLVSTLEELIEEDDPALVDVCLRTKPAFETAIETLNEIKNTPPEQAIKELGF